MAKKEEEKRPFRETEIFKTLRDFGIAALILSIIVGSLYAYARVWPPVVVVESGSMMHGDDSRFGVIDTGDIVLVKRVDSRGDVVTFVEGQKRGYETYSDYGDVIVYRPYGRSDVTPVIHRAMFWVEVNTTDNNQSNWTIRVPEIPKYANWVKEIDLPEFGLEDYKAADAKHSGFITKGDNNYYEGKPIADQHKRSRICREPVKLEWIMGVARGEIPWFGLIKLWATGSLRGSAPSTSVISLGISLFLIIGLPIIWDVYVSVMEGKKGKIIPLNMRSVLKSLTGPGEGTKRKKRKR